jgi:nitrite reductase/ring-hydroxylating ferredoxin subunit
MSTWCNAGHVDDFEVELPEEVTLLGTRVAVHRTPTDFFATAAICTHEHAELRDGFLDGWELTCPLHLARFDVRTGAALCPPATRPLTVYRCEVRDGDVWILVPDEPMG